jgi:PAS domain S-box-containing protein
MTAVDESLRLATLDAYAVLDTPPEREFDELAALAAQICGTPIGLVSLVDEHRQWFKARHGTELAFTRREHAFCAHAIALGGLLVVEDATADPRFASNPLVVSQPWLRAYAGSPLCVEGGAVLGTLCVIDTRPRRFDAAQLAALETLGRQVTARLELRRVNQRLARAHRRDHELALLTEMAPVGIFMSDAGSQCLYVSPAWCTLTGLSPTEALGSAWQAALDRRDRESVYEEWQRATAGGAAFDMEFRFARPNGDVRWVHCRAVPLDAAAGYVGIVEDVTDVRELQNALRASELRFREFATHAAVGIFVTDAAGACTYTNPRWNAITGLREGEAIGDGWRRAIPPEDLDALTGVWQDAIEARRPLEHTFRIRRPDGEVRWMQCRAVELPATPGAARQFLGTAEDITALRDSHDRIRQLTQRIERVRDQERKLLAGQLHDSVAQDLFAATLMLNRIGDVDPDPAVSRAVRAALQALLASTIDRLRNLTRELHPTELSHLELPVAIAQLAAKFTADSGIEVRVDSGAVLPRVDDAQRMALFRAAEEGLANIGRHANARSASIEFRVDESAVRMVVCDDGIGPARDRAPQVAPLGLLGLSERIRALGGELSLAAGAAGGAVLTVSLPLAVMTPGIAEGAPSFPEN